MGHPSPVAGRAGAVRIQRLHSVSLAAAEAHGKRLDANGKTRKVRDMAPVSLTGLNLRELHAAHIDGAARRKGAPDALHMILQFPTELVDGDEAEMMLAEARAFATSIFGDEAIFADRVDRDEKSQHVVDLFVAPKYEKVTKRNSKLTISTSKHLKELAAQYGKAPNLRGQGQALQDAWFEHLQNIMGLDVKRGSQKILPGSDWQSPEQLEQERLALENEHTRKRNAKALREATKSEVTRDSLIESLKTLSKTAEKKKELIVTADVELVHTNRQLADTREQIASAKYELLAVENDVAQKKTNNFVLRAKVETLKAKLKTLSAA